MWNGKGERNGAFQEEGAASAKAQRQEETQFPGEFQLDQHGGTWGPDRDGGGQKGQEPQAKMRSAGQMMN